MNVPEETNLAKEGKPPDSASSDESELDEEIETLSWDGMDDRDCFATVKTVCDTFTLQGSNSNEYFFYRVCVTVPDELMSAGCGSAKDELDQCVSALNGLGFILRSPIAEDVLIAKSDLFLSDSMMVMTVRSVGRVSSIPEGDMLQMQRFHRAVCCMEDVNAYSSDEYLNIDHDFSVEAEPTELIADDEWTQSSNGAWYLVYPLQDQCDTAPTESQCYDSAYLKRCADQAQALMHNLRVVGASNTKATCRMPEAESCAQYPQDTWKDLLILANGISLCCAAADTVQNRKTLNDVMKRVKYKPPPPPPAPEFVVVPARQEGSVVPFPAPLVVMRPEDAGPIPTVRVNYSEYIDITYADHFKAKRPHLTSVIEQYQKDPAHRLLAANQVSTKTAHTLLLTPICEDVRGNPDWIKRNSVHNARVERLHFLAEQCRPLGLQRWYFTSRLVPSVMHRIQSWCLAHEARALMTQRIEALDGKRQDGAPTAPGNSNQSDEMQVVEELKEVHLDGSGAGTPSQLPGQSRVPSLKLMLEAMTPRMVAESFDSERLETLGDAFLKYVISVELYKIRPDMREGQLTSARAAYINNRKQCQVCLSTGMSKYIRVIALSRGERLVTVCSPGMPAADLLPARSTWGTDIMATPAERKYRVEAMYRFPKPQHQRRTVLFKKLADMVEAVIGAYYVDGGEEAGIAAVKAFCTWPRNATPAASASAPPATATLQPPPPVPATASAGAKACHAALMAAYNNRMQTPQPPTYAPTPASRGKHYRGGPVHNNTGFHARFGGRPELYTSGGQRENPPEDSPNRKRPCGSSFASPLPPPFRSGPAPGFVPPPPTTPRPQPLSPPPPSRPNADLSDLEANLRYTFKDRSLLRLALTHSSMSRCNNAERLEFLGDAVLDFVTVSYWFRHNVAFEPMDLHEAKSRNTCNRNLASKAYSLGLHRFLQHNSDHLQAQLEQYCAEHFARDHRSEAAEPPVDALGAGETKGGSPTAAAAKDTAEGAVSTSDVLADTLEAVIGAIFLDCGEDTRVIEQFAADNNLLVAYA